MSRSEGEQWWNSVYIYIELHHRINMHQMHTCSLKVFIVIPPCRKGRGIGDSGGRERLVREASMKVYGLELQEWYSSYLSNDAAYILWREGEREKMRGRALKVCNNPFVHRGKPLDLSATLLGTIVFASTFHKQLAIITHETIATLWKQPVYWTNRVA